MLSCLIFFKRNLALFEPFMILRDEVTQTLVLFDSLIQMGQTTGHIRSQCPANLNPR